MSQLDDLVLGVYDEIFSLPVELQVTALKSWWDFLQSTCTPDAPCIECRREMEAIAREEREREPVICVCGDLAHCLECLDRAERTARRLEGR